MLKRTPILAVLFGAVIAFTVAQTFEDSARPFSFGQQAILFLFSILPGMGFAMLLDPYPRKKKEEYLKINFYEEQT